MKKTIVMAGDCHYLSQLETTLKSIFYHNKNINVYVLNQDIMPDWFRKPRKIARLLGGDVIDVKLPQGNIFQNWGTQNHISQIAYARYFIPSLIVEDKVLYLDSDLIVNAPLDDLWEINLGDQLLAAVMDTDGVTFNTGVMLINNAKWREENLEDKLVHQSQFMQKEIEEGRFLDFNGDQTIINQVCKEKWLELDRSFNLQVGHDIVAFYNNWKGHLEEVQSPVIIHYTTYRKPWTTLIANRYRELWWQVHDMEWTQMLQHHLGEFQLNSSKKETFSCLIVTNSQELEAIHQLVVSLPEITFNIAAWTDMGEKLLTLSVHENVRLYPQVVPPVLHQLEEKANLYLDINHGQEVQSVLEKMQKNDVPILSFLSTKHGEYGQRVVDSLAGMIESIQDYQQNGRFTKNLKPQFHALTFTASQELEGLGNLATECPEIAFHIAAWTDMGSKLYALSQKHENIYLYPAISRDEFERLKNQMDVYLDINLENSTSDIVAEIASLSKPMLAFYKSQNGCHGQRLYSSEHPEQMLADLRLMLAGNALKEQSKFPEVKGIDATLDYVIKNNASLIRFGDGEINLLAGHSIPYQDYDEELVSIMREIISLPSSEDTVICLPDIFQNRFIFTWWAIDFWKIHLDHYADFYQSLSSDSWYGSTFVSRPYIDFEDKTQANEQFAKLKSIWKGRDLLLIEGATSRSGVGNDLFADAKSIQRIICPSHSAYSRVDEIEKEIYKHANGRLILCMLGPTAKVLAYRLTKNGYQVLDIGHIDSEYEWMKMGAKTKIKFNHKHTAEYNFDQDIEFIEDETYTSQIVADLSK